MQKIKESEWDEVAHPYFVCELPMAVSKIESRLSLDFFDFEEDGLGQCFGCYLEDGEFKYFIRGYEDKDGATPGPSVYVRSFEPDPRGAVLRLCDALSIREEDLNSAADMTPPKWEVSCVNPRDSGTDARRFHEEASARYVRDVMIRDGHAKQCEVKRITGR